MWYISVFLLTPLMIALLAISFSRPLRERVLSIGAVASLEGRLKGNERLYWAAFALCMLAGVFVRCWRFGELPLGLNQDEAMAGVEAYCLFADGVDLHGISWPTYFTAWEYSQMSTLYSYLLVPFIRVLGLTRVTLRLPMLLVSLAMLPLLWDFARRIAGKGFALIVLFLLAANPWHIMLSRWALEANMLPHVLLTAMYLLFIGRNKRWALYLSMVFFGLTPYAYGLACFIIPVPMICMAVYYLVKRQIKALDLAVCTAIFSAVSWPYIATMVINAFELGTMTFGPFTMPYFEESQRANDMVFIHSTAYQMAIGQLIGFLESFVFCVTDSRWNAIDWAHAMYRFAVPLYCFGLFRLWRDRRNLARSGEEDEAFCAAGILLLSWMLGMTVNGMLSSAGGSINRNNALYYPLIIFTAYALWQMGKRLRVALAAAVTAFALAFVGLIGTYFFDETYKNELGRDFRYGLNEALTDTWDWDYDQYYFDTAGRYSAEKWMTACLMFAHQISYSERAEQTDLIGPDGEPSGWYYGERYMLTDFSDLELDPYECAVYICSKDRVSLFDPQEYLITEYGRYAAAYPRYWAE